MLQGLSPQQQEAGPGGDGFEAEVAKFEEKANAVLYEAMVRPGDGLALY